MGIYVFTVFCIVYLGFFLYVSNLVNLRIDFDSTLRMRLIDEL